MTQARDEVIRNRLKKMAVWAKERRSFFANNTQDWDPDLYIRIGGNGFRAISVDPIRPLLKLSSGYVPKIEMVLEQLRKVNPNNFGNIQNNNSHKERKAQAWLIKQAVNHSWNLKTYLGLESSLYDELLFTLDEVSLGDSIHPPIYRTDLIGVGVYHGTLYPVLIELKYGRHLTGKNDLLCQLNKYASEMKKFGYEFKQLLSECVGRDVELTKIGKIMVWPKSPSGKSSLLNDPEEQCRRQNITIIESNSDDWSKIQWSEITDTPFHVLNGLIYPPSEKNVDE